MYIISLITQPSKQTNGHEILIWIKISVKEAPEWYERQKLAHPCKKHNQQKKLAAAIDQNPVIL